MLEWIQTHDVLLWWMGLGSILTFVGSLIFVPYLVVRIPADYLVKSDERHEERKKQHPVLIVLGLILRNTLGLVLVVAGIAMLALPGQGLLTILIGLTLITFPGKHALMVKILGQPSLLAAINRMRSKRNRKPLRLHVD